jgi:hypothetical protein
VVLTSWARHKHLALVILLPKSGDERKTHPLPHGGTDFMGPQRWDRDEIK